MRLILYFVFIATASVLIAVPLTVLLLEALGIEPLDFPITVMVAAFTASLVLAIEALRKE